MGHHHRYGGGRGSWTKADTIAMFVFLAFVVAVLSGVGWLLSR